jgi:hypothetical protein
MMHLFKFLLLPLAVLPSVLLGQKIQKKAYKHGDSFSYQLITESSRNNQPDVKSIAVSWHTVIENHNQQAEEIRWIAKTVFVKKDTINYDSIAQKVKPYSVFPLSKDGLKLPPLVVPEMTGEITDLHTFYVAVSPTLHIERLSPRIPFFSDSVLHGQFADGVIIIKGEDKIQVSQKLISKDRKHTVVETSFKPPLQLSITPLLDTIGKQTFSQPNNFQMVRKGIDDRVNLLWGIEEFIITSIIDNKTGMLLNATMVNTLNLRMRYNASSDLQQYDAEIPLLIKRVVKLELIK